jgi:hypothetical protein
MNTHPDQDSYSGCSQPHGPLQTMGLSPGGICGIVTYDIIVGLRVMFENQARVHRFNTSKALFGCMLVEGTSVSPHVIKMIGYIESLQRLDSPLHDELAVDVILQSLPASFEPFTLNYNMNGLNKTLTELHGMLKRHM